MTRSNERRTVTWRRGYANAIEAAVCRKEFLTFEEWVRLLVRKELARVGLAIEEPRAGRKPKPDPEQPQPPPPVGLSERACDCPPDAHGEHCTFHPSLDSAPADTIIERAHKRNLEQIDKFEPVPDGGVASIIDDPPFTEPPPPVKDEDESELDAHDREINEKLKELQDGAEPF